MYGGMVHAVLKRSELSVSVFAGGVPSKGKFHIPPIRSLSYTPNCEGQRTDPNREEPLCVYAGSAMYPGWGA